MHTFLTLRLKTLHSNPRSAHKMQNTSHLLQNEALHSKYHKHISKANICHNINSCQICVCYIENCVLCFASVLWNWKLSQRLIISVWFCRFGVFLLFEWQLSETVSQVKIWCESSWKNCNIYAEEAVQNMQHNRFHFITVSSTTLSLANSSVAGVWMM